MTKEEYFIEVWSRCTRNQGCFPVVACVGVAAALELKDKLWGGKPDWIDFSLTVLGVNLGYAVRYFAFNN